MPDFLGKHGRVNCGPDLSDQQFGWLFVFTSLKFAWVGPCFVMNCLYAPTIYSFILFTFELWKRIPSLHIMSPGTCSSQCNSVTDAHAYVWSMLSHFSWSQSLSWHGHGAVALGSVCRSFPQIHTEEQSGWVTYTWLSSSAIQVSHFQSGPLICSPRDGLRPLPFTPFPLLVLPDSLFFGQSNTGSSVSHSGLNSTL